MKSLFNCGVSTFESGLTQRYYELLLLGKKYVDPRLKGKDLKRHLANVKSDTISLAALDREPEGPPRPSKRAAVAAPDVSGDCDSVAGGDSEVHMSGAEEAPEAVEMAARAASSSSSEHGPDPDAAVEVNYTGQARDWPTELCGQRVKFIKGKHDEQGTYFCRLRVECPNPMHVNCHKSRSVNLLVGELGPAAPTSCLMAWLNAAHMPQARHFRHAPSIADLRALL